ncbi:MAG TPA: hypothetical protein VLY87_03855 [Flavobacterium sp.]|nr:hypothetical protein [Flavobacterium sp.]
MAINKKEKQFPKRSLEQWQKEAILQNQFIERQQNSLTEEQAREQAMKQADKIREERRREQIL